MVWQTPFRGVAPLRQGKIEVALPQEGIILSPRTPDKAGTNRLFRGIVVLALDQLSLESALAILRLLSPCSALFHVWPGDKSLPPVCVMPKPAEAIPILRGITIRAADARLVGVGGTSTVVHIGASPTSYPFPEPAVPRQ